jgi:TPP-dependent pyruvate/acetoin dehydrogenase alpha subunit
MKKSQAARPKSKSKSAAKPAAKSVRRPAATAKTRARTPDRATLLHLFEQMVLLRRFELSAQ